MRVDAYNQITQIYQTTNAKVKSTNKKEKASDSLELSQTGKDYQIAKQAAKDAPDIREDKVNQLKEQLKSGTYQVTGEEFAEKILERYFNSII
ncbi:flagellar biosynthesis anti-sigma factor FlgM [Velocimicrobium porci]|uniref:Negative regulator of flagellin synthesis n=1 Tax=Velocimicrobium porci TaxID=2606634 RepID=A0A6L5Y0C4_9FIRM|nr:flagellar biosynthesis anti-sigma factor FlgM [Velocimicrobium porci]MSS63878.1 flagellar biosynthesis anti-sigma factor FlgM [Velocimicrobium porci]